MKKARKTLAKTSPKTALVKSKRTQPQPKPQPQPAPRTPEQPAFRDLQLKVGELIHEITQLRQSLAGIRDALRPQPTQLATTPTAAPQPAPRAEQPPYMGINRQTG